MVDWNTDVIVKFTDTSNITLVKGAMGRSACCSQWEATAAKCGHQWDYTDKTDDTNLSPRMPTSRIWYKGPHLTWTNLKLLCPALTSPVTTVDGTVATTACANAWSAGAEGNFLLASATQVVNKVTVPIWNEDFLLASLWQLGFKTDATTYCTNAGT